MPSAKSILKYDSGQDYDFFTGVCSLCSTRNGVFSNMDLINVAVTLKDVLNIEIDRAKHKQICHRCIFKLELLKEFCAKDVAITNTKFCIYCGNTSHTTLKTSNPTVSKKIKVCGLINKTINKNGPLCTTCFYKLELLEELLVLSSKNCNQEIYVRTGDDKEYNGNLISVKDLVDAGLIKVGSSISCDKKMFLNISKVSLSNFNKSHKSLQNSKSIQKTKIGWKLKVKAKDRSFLNKHKHKKVSNDSIVQVENSISVLEERSDKVQEKINAASKKCENMKKDVELVTKHERVSSPEENTVIVHQDNITSFKDFKIPVIVLTREDFNGFSGQSTPLRKRALKLMNKLTDDIKVPKVHDKSLTEIRETEHKENIPAEHIEKMETDAVNLEDDISEDKLDDNTIKLTSCEQDKSNSTIEKKSELFPQLSSENTTNVEDEDFILPKFNTDDSESEEESSNISTNIDKLMERRDKKLQLTASVSNEERSVENNVKESVETESDEKEYVISVSDEKEESVDTVNNEKVSVDTVNNEKESVDTVNDKKETVATEIQEEKSVESVSEENKSVDTANDEHQLIKAICDDKLSVELEQTVEVEVSLGTVEGSKQLDKKKCSVEKVLGATESNEHEGISKYDKVIDVLNIKVGDTTATNKEPIEIEDKKIKDSYNIIQDPEDKISKDCNIVNITKSTDNNVKNCGSVDREINLSSHCDQPNMEKETSNEKSYRSNCENPENGDNEDELALIAKHLQEFEKDPLPNDHIGQ